MFVSQKPYFRAFYSPTRFWRVLSAYWPLPAAANMFDSQKWAAASQKFHFNWIHNPA
jgi:hypothetical protein